MMRIFIIQVHDPVIHTVDTTCATNIQYIKNHIFVHFLYDPVDFPAQQVNRHGTGTGISKFCRGRDGFVS